MASRAGINSSPISVSVYSTDGGEVGRTCRFNTPRSPSSDSRADKTFAEIGGISTLSSLKRRGPALRHQMTLGAQAPAMIAMHSVSMHGSGGVGLLLRRTFKDISVTK